MSSTQGRPKLARCFAAHLTPNAPLAALLSGALLASALFVGGCDTPGADSASSAPAEEATAAPTPAQPAPAQTAQNRPQPALPAATRPASFADLVAEVRPAVVNIYTRQEIRTPGRFNPFSGSRIVPQRRVAESLGSGFIIDAGGQVLTNYHVIKDATEIGVRLFDNRLFKAEVIGTDPKTDVALLQIIGAKSDLPTIKLGDAKDLRVGDWVVAIGNPLGLTSTVTAGIASAIGRHNLPLGGAMSYQDFIQTDASINPGNSGGPLINTQGEVVGINTAVSAEGQGIGFATPINMAVEILEQLQTNGRVERSWLGIYADDVPRRVREELGLPDDISGALVTNVVAGGPAEKVGLKRGDILLRINSQPINDAKHLAWMASNLGIGKTVELEFWHYDAIKRTQLTLGALPN
ncbi:trypsin-like peptidase domain-containing protein [Bradymonas sediminis]|nr:trypsin-like peptidase domain-containing protein [Bradymonas sediminis]TDP72129.1 serine protease Do [Bradymonas sediminis]